MRRLVLLAALVASLAAPAADAAPRKARHGNDLTIHRRSYFDAGVLVKPGTGPSLNYVTASQNATPVYQHAISQFGGETLPQRFDLPRCCGVPVSRFVD